MIYDGYDFSHLLTVEDVRRPLLPDVELDTSDSGGPGTVLKGASLGPSQVEVDVRMIAGFRDPMGRRLGLEQLRRNVAARLWKGGLRKLVLHDAPDLWNWASLTGSTDLERFLHTGGTTLVWYCPDPAWHGKEKSKSCDGGQVQVNVGGTYATAPVVEVETQGSEATVYFDGKAFRAEGNIASDDPLTIDAPASDCWKGDAYVAVNIMDSYPAWEPGLHTVQCSLPFTVRWEERWL